jgi:hypothetical protein
MVDDEGFVSSFSSLCYAHPIYVFELLIYGINEFSVRFRAIAS